MNQNSALTPFGLLGKTLGHSYSPQIHNALGNPHYVLYERAPQELTEFLAQPELKGLNVTIPYKKDVMSACQTLSDAAKHIGASIPWCAKPTGVGTVTIQTTTDLSICWSGPASILRIKK